MERLDLSAPPARAEPTGRLSARALAVRFVGGVGVVSLLLGLEPEAEDWVTREIHDDVVVRPPVQNREENEEE